VRRSSVAKTTTTGTGRSGTGLVLGELPTGINSPVGGPISGRITAAAANIPDRTSVGGLSTSLHKLAAADPGFMMLNEVNKRTIPQLEADAPGYAGYRDPVQDRSTGGPTQSMENVVLWRSSSWHLLDGGRVKIVDNDQGYHNGHAFTWDRYATWTILQRNDGAIVSAVATHMMTNPTRFPRQHGNPPLTRVQQFEKGMEIFDQLVERLSAYGPVFVGGDMNSHPNDGPWTTKAHMVADGYGYTKDSGVMYLFFPQPATAAASHQMKIVSDHPALVSTINMNGAAGSGDVTSPPTTTGTTTPTSPTEPTEPTQTTTTTSAPAAPVMPSGETLTAAQLDNAATIVDRGRAARLPQVAWVDAVAAALAESDLQNLAPRNGAVGLFQQSPSRGWGTTQELSTPSLAADAFYGASSSDSRVKGLQDYSWTSMSLPEVDGAVLGTVFPEKYADRGADAQFVVNYLLSRGQKCDASSLTTCPTARRITRTGIFTAAANKAVDCLRKAFPSLRRYVGDRTGRYCDGSSRMSGLDVPVAAIGRSFMTRSAQSLGHRTAHYLQEHAADLGVKYLVFAGRSWSSDEPDAGWRPYAASNGSHTRQAEVYDRVYAGLKSGRC